MTIGSQKWRLNNLYHVVDEQGRDCLFTMRPAQEAFFDSYHYYNIILKARQLGFTTFIDLMALDMALFIPNPCAAGKSKTQLCSQAALLTFGKSAGCGYCLHPRLSHVSPFHGNHPKAVMPLSLRLLSIPPNGTSFIQKRASRYPRSTLFAMFPLKNEFLEVALKKAKRDSG